ncbi:DUF4089 domain-containing protein [Novosphingobium sp. G106]|uniref:AtzG-like protein n=1 Tax=Novosphingobium sp. G106 TaxID=2849500 RepID=UPI001C2DB414|nr:AtzG-like protein [Novosphingobium sp. G106]MBV1688486.1 DUF4089 domain-containing protein [Novosphingobium sp. G106]
MSGAQTPPAGPAISEDTLIGLAGFAGIEIAPEYRAGVIRNLEILAAQAALLAAAPVDQRVEPAPVFRT